MPDTYKRHISGLLIPKEHYRPMAVDFFSGAGGFSLGFEAEGWDVVGAADKDPTACLTYMANLGHPMGEVQFLTMEDREAFMKAKDRADKRRAAAGKPPWQIGVTNPGTCRVFWLGDASLLTGERVCRDLGIGVGELAAIFGGPPCQGFSTANRARALRGEGGIERNLLVLQMVRLILELKPLTFAIENVTGLLSMTTLEGVPMADLVVAALSEEGYGSQHAVRQALGLRPGSRGTVRTQKERTGNRSFSAEIPRQPGLFEEAAHA